MTATDRSGIDRRTFFRRSAGAAAGLAVVSQFDALGARVAGAAPAAAGSAKGPKKGPKAGADYGPL